MQSGLRVNTLTPFPNINVRSYTKNLATNRAAFKNKTQKTKTKTKKEGETKISPLSIFGGGGKYQDSENVPARGDI